MSTDGAHSEPDRPLSDSAPSDARLDVPLELPTKEELEAIPVVPWTPEPMIADSPDISIDRFASSSDGRGLPEPGFWGAVGWCLLALFGVVVAGCFVGLAFGVGLKREEQAASLAIGRQLLFVAPSLIIVLIAALNLRLRFRRALAVRGIAWLHVAVLALLLLPMWVLSCEISTQVTHGLDALFGRRAPGPLAVGGSVSVAAYFRAIDQVTDELLLLPWPLVLLLGCLLPGVTEEVFFRGFLGRGLVARFGCSVGIFLTSLLFALFHIDPVHMAYTLVLGMVLHVVYLTTKSLLAPIVLHTLYNAVAVGCQKLTLEGTLTLTDASGELVIPPTLVAISFGAVLILCWLLYRTRVRWTLADGNEWSPGYLSAEMHPAESITPRRGSASAWTLALTGGAYLLFGIFFVQAGIGWSAHDAVFANVQRADAHRAKGEFDLAIAACNEAIRDDPNIAFAYEVRGEAYRMKAMHAEALADFNTSLRLDASNAQVYANRAESHRLQGNFGLALADCNRAIELKGKLGWAYTIRGNVQDDLKQYARAIADYDESLKLDPNHTWTRSKLAWLLATCPDARLRNGPRAVTLGEHARDQTQSKDAFALAALAAAHAECGAFEKAVRTQEQAMSLTVGQVHADYRTILDVYRAGQPFHDVR